MGMLIINRLWSYSLECDSRDQGVLVPVCCIRHRVYSSFLSDLNVNIFTRGYNGARCASGTFKLVCSEGAGKTTPLLVF